MQVPRSAIGKMGMCPTCGRSTRISSANTRPLPNHGRGPAVHEAPRRPRWGATAQETYAEPPEEAKQRFGQAVDHYYAGRYAEALAIFDTLAHDFPGNPDIEHGRGQCMKAMKRPALAAPTGVAQPRRVQGELDEETIRRVVLDKLLNGATEEVQLRAAEIACKYLKLDAAPKSKPEPVETEMTAQPGRQDHPDYHHGNGHTRVESKQEESAELYPPREASNG